MLKPKHKRSGRPRGVQPDPDGRFTNVKLGLRSCLTCGRAFLSQGPGNRRCRPCQQKQRQVGLCLEYPARLSPPHWVSSGA